MQTCNGGGARPGRGTGETARSASRLSGAWAGRASAGRAVRNCGVRTRAAKGTGDRAESRGGGAQLVIVTPAAISFGRGALIVAVPRLPGHRGLFCRFLRGFIDVPVTAIRALETPSLFSGSAGYNCKQSDYTRPDYAGDTKSLHVLILV